MNTKLYIYTSALSALALSFASGATLTNVTSGGTSIGSVNMTTEGTTNWAIWDTSSGATASIAPTQFKASGTGTIGSMTFVAGSGVRGTTSTGTSSTFDWTQSDEASNTAADGNVTGVFNSTLNQVNHGVTFSITDLPTLTGGQTYRINVYTVTFYGSGLFSADINGGSSITQSGLSQTSAQGTDYFTIDYNPDALSDELNISFVLTGNNTGNTSSNVRIQGVAISAIPEPSQAAMLLGGLSVALIALRRRKK